ncbi:hypothetical protein GGR53DRAFT_468662 [Hypoxylon sp. FL1150]|nr:hypothetical protein GGR53DRAFT_468662 [Hypoxylon sp. FL1150]
MSQLALSESSNLFVLQQQFAKEGSRDAWFMSACLDGNAMSEAQREAKAEAAKNCSWRGDSPEPELDDLAHSTSNHRFHHRPAEALVWQADPPEPEPDDLAHRPDKACIWQAGSPEAELQHSRKLSQLDPQPIEIEQSNTAKKRKKSKKPDEQEDLPIKPPKGLSKVRPHAEPPEDHHSRDQTYDTRSEAKLSAHPHDNEPTYDEKQGQEPYKAPETLRGRVTQGVQQAFSTLQGIIKYEPQNEAEKPTGKANPQESNEPPPSELQPVPEVAEPTSFEIKNPNDDKERAKREKEKVKKAQKEKKAEEKEEKKRAKKEKEEAKKQKERERKEQRRREKEAKKNKGKGTAPPPSASHPEAADPHPHPGCKICQDPQEQGVLEFLGYSLENWRGLPSVHDLTEAARSFLGMHVETESQATREQPQGVSPEDQELLDHIAEHINAHVRQFRDPKATAAANNKTPPYSFPPHSSPPSKPPSGRPNAPGKQHESDGNGGTVSDGNGGNVSHGLDGNRDWPMTIKRGQTLRRPGSVSPPEFSITQPPSRGYSPHRATATSRCISPWCEQLGFTMENPRPFPQRAISWSRRE